MLEGASHKKIVSDLTTLSLRRAVPEDRDRMLHWRNDPWIASLSTRQRSVGKDEHARWFATMLGDPDKLPFIVMLDGLDIGVVRIDRLEPARAAITVYLLRPFTGRGLGPESIRQGSREAFAAWPSLRTIHARIRRDNPASAAAFRKAGYADCPQAERGALRENLIEMRLERPRQGANA